MNKGMIQREAGATFSRKNRSVLKQVVELLRTALSDAGITDDEDAENADPLAEAGGFSMSDLYTLLDTELRADLPPDAPYNRIPQIADVFDTFLVWREGYNGVFYQASYTVDENGNVTIGVPSLVIRKVQYVQPGDGLPVSESDAENLPVTLETDAITLTERAVTDDGTMRIKIIAPGIGSSGYYPADVLARDGARAFPKGTQMFWDHATAAEESARPEGSLDRLAAVLESDAEYDPNGTRGAGLYATVRARSDFRTVIDELAPHIGVSIRASGRARMGEIDGKRMPIIDAITDGKSIDFVTKPGAGGKILQLFEAARNTPPKLDERIDQMAMNEADRAAIAEMVATAIREAVTPLQAQIATHSDARDLETAQRTVTGYLNTIESLPRVTRERLAPEIARGFTRDDTGAINTAALLEAARLRVVDELRYLGAAGARVTAIGLGESGTTVTPPDPQAIDAEMRTIFGDWGLTESGAAIAARGRR